MHSNHFSNSFWIWTNARFEASEFFSILIENELRNEIDLFVCGYIIQLIDVNLKYEYVRQDTASNPLLTLRNNTFSNSLDIFSSMGPTSLHGLHQVAQKFAQTKISWNLFYKINRNSVRWTIWSEFIFWPGHNEYKSIVTWSGLN